MTMGVNGFGGGEGRFSKLLNLNFEQLQSYFTIDLFLIN